MTYATSHMTKELSSHVLERVSEGVYRLGRPGDCIYHVYIAEFAERICIAGDICLGGGRENGIVSDAGYKLPWFAGRLSESYLCEKFLRHEWQWDAAVEEIRDRIEADAKEGEGWWFENADKLRKFLESPGWKYDVPNDVELYEFLSELDPDCCECPGQDYPRAQAGWLCAIQQRYSVLRSLG